jgi:2-dehydropantoate 2-reductase
MTYFNFFMDGNTMNRQMPAKIAVVGAGAVGSLLGGLLARAGADVTLIGRPEHVEAISRTGLHIEGASGNFTIPLHAENTLNFRPDLVLLAVKMLDVETTCRHIAPYVKDVPIVALQNGVRGDEIAGRVLGERNIIGGIVLFNAQFLKAGQVTHGSAGALLIGNVFQANDERARDVAHLLNRILPTELCDEIKGARWTKLLLNVLGNSLDAMTGMSMRMCMKTPELRKIGTLILKEALKVVEKAGIKLAPLPGLPIPAFKFIIKSPLPISSRLLEFRTGKMDTVSSALQSLRRGRPTEIDYLNGEIVRLGKNMNIATPFNAKVVEVVREIEKTHQFYSLSQIENFFFT